MIDLNIKCSLETTKLNNQFPKFNKSHHFYKSCYLLYRLCNTIKVTLII